MASNPNHSRQRAFKLGRSSLTGQYVLKPVGTPTRTSLKSSSTDADFSSVEVRVLRLAARKISNADIASQLGLSDPQVRNVLNRAKSRFRTTSRSDAARQFIRAMERGDSYGSNPI